MVDGRAVANVVTLFVDMRPGAFSSFPFPPPLHSLHFGAIQPNGLLGAPWSDGHGGGRPILRAWRSYCGREAGAASAPAGRANNYLTYMHEAVGADIIQAFRGREAGGGSGGL